MSVSPETHDEPSSESEAPQEFATDDDHWAVLSAAWEDDQLEEYESYGDSFRAALLTLHKGDAQGALETFEQFLGSAQEPRYLHFEIGRTRLALRQTEAGEESLRLFLNRIGADEGGDARLVSHFELARIADDRNDVEGAISEYDTAIGALTQDPRPYLALGHYLRTKGCSEEAAEVLESGARVMSPTNPDWRLIEQLGLAQSEAGKTSEAKETLKYLISFFTRQRLDPPPAAVEALAKLQEAS